jgi:hypothetical protein
MPDVDEPIELERPGFSEAVFRVALNPAREKFPHKPRSERFRASKAVPKGPI